ncbi:MAG: YrrS family protein [Sporolactobacillus sp.]
MRNHRGDGLSRVDNRKSRTDRVLNWIIGIVSVLILVVGCFILITVFRASSSNSSASAGTSSKQQVEKTQSKKTTHSKQDSGEVSNDASSSSEASSSSVSDADHQASYDQGTADWNAQVAAISSATGISVSQMTILWLGNGGSPNMSLARVAPKSSSNSVYVVHLTYKGGKWQADSVQKP